MELGETPFAAVIILGRRFSVVVKFAIATNAVMEKLSMRVVRAPIAVVRRRRGKETPLWAIVAMAPASYIWRVHVPKQAWLGPEPKWLQISEPIMQYSNTRMPKTKFHYII